VRHQAHSRARIVAGTTTTLVFIATALAGLNLAQHTGNSKVSARASKAAGPAGNMIEFYTAGSSRHFAVDSISEPLGNALNTAAAARLFTTLANVAEDSEKMENLPIMQAAQVPCLMLSRRFSCQVQVALCVHR